MLIAPSSQPSHKWEMQEYTATSEKHEVYENPTHTSTESLTTEFKYYSQDKEKFVILVFFKQK